MFIHTLSTWLLANVIHPFMLFFCVLVVSNFTTAPDAEMIGLIVPLIFVSCVVSIPTLVISWLMLQMITQVVISPEIKFLLWLITGPAMIILQFLVMSILLDVIPMSEVELIVPAILSAVTAILCRYNAFMRRVEPPVMEEEFVDIN